MGDLTSDHIASALDRAKLMGRKYRSTRITRACEAMIKSMELAAEKRGNIARVEPSPPMELVRYVAAHMPAGVGLDALFPDLLSRLRLPPD